MLGNIQDIEKNGKLVWVDVVINSEQILNKQDNVSKHSRS
jgi:hypothetical protein